jgi:UDP-3-O-[3-hydroxymyristoyl] glucosamine N-acyltransferase
MPDPRFFAPVGPSTLGEPADRTGADIAAGADRALALSDVAPLETAGPRRRAGYGDRRRHDD